MRSCGWHFPIAACLLSSRSPSFARSADSNSEAAGDNLRSFWPYTWGHSSSVVATQSNDAAHCGRARFLAGFPGYPPPIPHRFSCLLRAMVKRYHLDLCGVPVLGIYAIDAPSKGIYIDPKLGTLLCISLVRTYSIG